MLELSPSASMTERKAVVKNADMTGILFCWLLIIFKWAVYSLQSVCVLEGLKWIIKWLLVDWWVIFVVFRGDAARCYWLCYSSTWEVQHWERYCCLHQKRYNLIHINTHNVNIIFIDSDESKAADIFYIIHYSLKLYFAHLLSITQWYLFTNIFVL